MNPLGNTSADTDMIVECAVCDAVEGAVGAEPFVEFSAACLERAAECDRCDCPEPCSCVADGRVWRALSTYRKVWQAYRLLDRLYGRTAPIDVPRYMRVYEWLARHIDRVATL